MKASLQPKPMYCSRDYYYSSRFNQQYEKPTPNIRKVFCLRDEIGTCPNIEVEIDVTDNSLFFIRPYHVQEEDKNFINKEMKWQCYLGILKEGFSAYSSPGFSAYSSPVMLISRKVTQDKRVLTDFRHLNVRIAKINLAYPLIKDTFSVLGRSRCEVAIGIRSKGCFSFIKALRKF